MNALRRDQLQGYGATGSVGELWGFFIPLLEIFSQQATDRWRVVGLEYQVDAHMSFVRFYQTAAGRQAAKDDVIVAKVVIGVFERGEHDVKQVAREYLQGVHQAFSVAFHFHCIALDHLLKPRLLSAGFSKLSVEGFDFLVLDLDGLLPFLEVSLSSFLLSKLSSKLFLQGFLCAFFGVALLKLFLKFGDC